VGRTSKKRGRPSGGGSTPCPECGELLSLDRSFCRACGYEVALDDASAAGEGLDLPQGYGKGDPSGFEYDEFLESEGLRPPSRRRIPLIWVLVALALVLAFLFGWVI
jgi:hypothetical protein